MACAPPKLWTFCIARKYLKRDQTAEAWERAEIEGTKEIHVIGGVDRVGNSEYRMADWDPTAKTGAIFNVINHERRIVENTDHLSYRHHVLVFDF